MKQLRLTVPKAENHMSDFLFVTDLSRSLAVCGISSICLLQRNWNFCILLCTRRLYAESFTFEISGDTLLCRYCRHWRCCCTMLPIPVREFYVVYFRWVVLLYGHSLCLNGLQGRCSVLCDGRICWVVRPTAKWSNQLKFLQCECTFAVCRYKQNFTSWSSGARI